MDITLNSLLQITNSSCYHPMMYFGYFLSILFFIGIFVFILIVNYLNFKRFMLTEKHDKEQLENFNSKFGLFYEPFQEDGSKIQQSFYLLIIIKRILIIFYIVFLSDFPAAVQSLIMITQLTNSILLIIYKPYSQKFYQIKDVLNSCSFMIIYCISLSILNNQGQSPDVRQ